MKNIINKKSITITVLILISVLVISILIFILTSKKVEDKYVSIESTDILNADVTTINYLKELNLNVFASIINGDIEYTVSISPKDITNTLSSLYASGSILVPVKVEVNGTTQTRLLNLIVDNFKKDDNGNIVSTNIYHEDGVILKEIKRKVDTLSSTLDFEYLYANYE